MPNDINSNNIIIFDRVGRTFDKEVALRGASFSVASGEFVCLIGPSGAGKSTILKIIAGFEKESSGKVIRPENVAVVFQGGALFPWLTVFDNVALGIRTMHVPESTAYKETNRYIEMMGLANFVSKYPRELSGGQRQRVGLARALAVNPSVLLLDEPFSELDIKTTEELHKDLIRMWKETQKTIVMVSHSIEEAVTLADRIILVKDFTVAHTFDITLPRPRREQESGFEHEVMQIRREFFK